LSDTEFSRVAICHASGDNFAFAFAFARLTRFAHAET